MMMGAGSSSWRMSICRPFSHPDRIRPNNRRINRNGIGSNQELIGSNFGLLRIKVYPGRRGRGWRGVEKDLECVPRGFLGRLLGSIMLRCDG